jgi:hypothetical protein
VAVANTVFPDPVVVQVVAVDQDQLVVPHLKVVTEQLDKVIKVAKVLIIPAMVEQVVVVLVAQEHVAAATMVLWFVTTIIPTVVMVVQDCHTILVEL